MRIFKRQRGFTFVELVMSIVVIGIAVTGVLLVYTQTVARSADPMVRQQALAVAEAYLEEILAKHHDDPGGPAGPSRNQFDHVADYAGLSESPPVAANGTVIAALSAYTVNVAVDGGANLNGTPASRVDVTVTHTSGISVSLWGYRTNYP